ncbi:hypothetical protein BH18ACI4_BH18ACI4_23130 [soil metagenome]
MIAPDKLVSVIIPCYNQARFLGEAIESALQQTYQHLEVIVVDDGSTDHTSDVAANYRKIVTVRQQNQGVSAARNNGVRVSSGSYLVFLDSDDRLLPQALRVGMMQLLDHTECAFVFGRHRDIAADGTALSTNPFVGIEKDPYRQLLLYNCIYTPSTAMFRRGIFESEGGFDPLLAGAEDYDLYLRIAKKFLLFGYEEIVAEYRRHDANRTGDNAQMLKACVAALRKQKGYVRGNPDWKKAYQDGMNHWRRLWGERLVSQIWSRFKEGREWKHSVRDVIMLMHYGPDVFPRLLARKITRPLMAAQNHKRIRSLDLK